jgi:hypothetical protein
MNNSFRFFKQLLIVAIALALLTSTRPIVGQSDQTTLTPELRQFLQERIEQPDQAIGRRYPASALTPTSLPDTI